MREIRHIGIIGEGRMGSSIFLYLIGFPYRIYWLCRTDGSREASRKLFLKKMNSRLHCGLTTPDEFARRLANTVITANLGDLKKCDLVIEAITESEELKRALYIQLDREIQPDCLFCTNSSGIVPTRLIPSVRRSDRMAGMHFFFPVQVKQWVEVITTSSTAPSVKEKLACFLSGINKKPFFQGEDNPFILNRVFLDFQVTAYEVYQEGLLSLREIDELVKEHLFPFGVFEFFDQVGNDVMMASIKSYKQYLDNSGIYEPLIEKLDEMVRQNELGVKTKKGFYDYSHPGRDLNLENRAVPRQDVYSSEVVERLRKSFNRSVQSMISSGSVTLGELTEALKDYTGLEEVGWDLNL